MTALTGRKPGASYTELLKLASGTVSGTLQRIQDGAGNNTPISISSTEISFNSVKLTNLAEPIVASDAATKQYVDNATPTLDSDLVAIANLSTNGIITRTGTGTASTRTITGTSNRIVVTDGDGVSGNPTLDIGTDVVTLTGTQTLINKTLTDSTTFFQDESDNTKKLQFQLSGITTGVTRTLTAPNSNGTIATEAFVNGLIDPANFRKLFKFVATSGQTTFSGLDYNSITLAYQVGFVDVYLNGAKLDITTDFTASTGTSIVLASGATLNDILEIVAYTPATIANSVPLSGGTMTGNLNTPSINSGPLAGFRNVIINGNFDMWQRGVSLSSGTGARYLSDRWRSFSVGTTYTVSRQVFTLGQTSVPYEPEYYHRIVVTSVAGASNFCSLGQLIEDVRTFAGQTITLSFYAKADTSKSISTEFIQIFGSGGSPSADVTTIGVNKINLTSSWQKFTHTISVPSISGQTLGTNNDDCLVFNMWFEAGSTFNARTNTLGQQSGTFDIAQVQVELGTQATPFERRHISLEQNMCFRYYERRTQSWGNTYPDGAANVDIRGRNYSAATNAVALNIKYKAVKRKIPTVAFQYDVNDGASSAGSPSVNYADGFFADINIAAGAFLDISDWQADAEF